MEANVAECKTCHKKMLKIVTKTIGKNKLFVNEFGELWNGRQCAGCNRDRLKTYMRNKRNVIHILPPQ